jgi:phenylacetate-CoA ligase
MKDLLEKFKESTPFYQKKLKEIRCFDEIPVTLKNELLESQSTFPPYGNFTNSNVKINQVYRTSGTTSTPLLLCFSKNDVKIITDIGKECLEYAGMGSIGNREIVLNCLNLSMWVGGVLDSQSIMKTGVQVINYGTGNTSGLINLIKKLNSSSIYKVSIHCTPSYLQIIENKLLEEFNMIPKQLKVSNFYLGGEGGLQDELYRKMLCEKWQSRVINANYGLSEICSALASANDLNLLRFSPLFINKYFLEIQLKSGIIKQYQDIIEGDTGELIVSSFEKENQPLLRYNTKEIIRIIRIEKGEIFFEIVGRSDDMLIYKGVNFFPEQFRSIIIRFPELTGRYKIQISKQNSLISEINLVCETVKQFTINRSDLTKVLARRVKESLNISTSINLVDKFDYKGNKFNIIEFI